MAYPKIRLRGNYVLLARAPREEKIGSIIVPDTAQKQSDRGTVVIVGPGLRSTNGTLIPCEVRAGETVIFPSHLGTEIVIDGTKYTLISEDLISGVEEA